jgi:hypothetical protein
MLHTVFKIQLFCWLAGVPLFAFGLTDQAIAFSIGRFSPWLNVTLTLTACTVAVGWLFLCPMLWFRYLDKR